MGEAIAVIPEEQDLLLSTLSPGPAQKKLALAVIVGFLIAVFIIVGPLSTVPPFRVDAFVPAYSTAMFVTDLMTAILLFSQFVVLRSVAILVIASGYLYTALIEIPWLLTFPGVFAPTGLIGGLQSTVWLYFFWHTGFPVFVVGYAVSKDVNFSGRFWPGTVRAAIALSVVLTVALVSLLTFLCVANETQLPRVMVDTYRFGPLWPFVGGPVALLSISAIIILWLRLRSMLDLWLTVVMCLYLIEIVNYFPAPSRFSVGWYGVRVVGFLSSSLVLILLLYEITTLYASLLSAVRAQRREREARLITGGAVAASIAHEVKQPLSAMITRADTTVRLLDRAPPDLDKAKQTLKKIAADGHRAAAVIEGIRESFKKDARSRSPLNVNDLIAEALTLVSDQLRSHRVLVAVEPRADIPRIMGDRIQLLQVLLNLITNAIDAMAAKDGPRLLCVRSGIGDDDSVLVSVADTGTGVGSQDIERVFSPLFTTKSDGMGMGLSISRSIIEAHDGHLLVTPNTPQGAVFQFALHPARTTRHSHE